MKLHLNPPYFRAVLLGAERATGKPRGILEKDYYITLLLKELSDRGDSSYAYFKGGTALYKALKSIRRFSEDVDLTVQVADCATPSQRQRRLEKAVLKFKCLEKQEVLENKRSTITCLYKYNSVFKDLTDPMERFGNVKVEGTSFTISKPSKMLQIAPHLYELADEERKRILEEEHDVRPFLVPTITLERIFIDKVFALEYYFARSKFQDVSKHAYDLTILLETEDIQRFLKDENWLKEVISCERDEQELRFGGIPSSLRIQNFSVFDDFALSPENERRFEDMQGFYVYDRRDRMKLEIALIALNRIREALAEIEA